MYVCVNVVLGRDRVEDEVEAVYMLVHLISISRNDHFVCAEAKRIFFLVRRSGKDYDMGTKRMSKLYCHITAPAETNHTDLLAFGDAPMPHRRICCNSGA